MNILRLPLYLRTLGYFLYIVVLTIIYLAVLPLMFVKTIILKNESVKDLFRQYNHLYGRYLIRLSWPLIRLEISGSHHIAENQPGVIVVNHRSSLDIFFCAFCTPQNVAVFVRSWPFKIWFLNWFMRKAGYLDIEKSSFPVFLDGYGSELHKKGISFLLFPEGHRSRDGKLHNFRTGAFLLATKYNIPIIPVSLTGTEKFLPIRDPWIRPAKIKIDILPPIFPDSFPKEKRALKLKKHTESLLREYLNGIDSQ